MKQIRIFRDSGQSIKIQTPSGPFVVQIVSTRHGYGMADPNTYCIGATAPHCAISCHLSESRRFRRDVVSDWENGFNVTCESAEPRCLRDEILQALVLNGDAEIVDALDPLPL